MEGIEQEIVGGQQTSFGPGLHDGTDIVPYYKSLLLCIIHMVHRYQHVVQSVQKCQHVGCVVWTTVSMVLEDTSSMPDGSTHCDGEVEASLMVRLKPASW